MYFSKFPVVKYPIFNGEKMQAVFACNILRRVALSETLRDGDGIFIEYSVKDGEKPEHIAERIYGNPNLHWIVLLTNTIIDPYHGWYKSNGVMETLIQKKHNGDSVFFTDRNNAFLFDNAISDGAIVSQLFNLTSISQSVLQYEPTLCKIVVGSSAFVKGDAIIELTSGITYGIKIQRIIPSYLAVNHFEIVRPANDVGESVAVIVDPLSERLGSYHSVLDGRVDLGDVVGSGSFSDSCIGRYMGLCGGTVVDNFAITNQSHEIEMNDKNRVIKILHPRYKDMAVKELTLLLKV